jgi:hypothetical protein
MRRVACLFFAGLLLMVVGAVPASAHSPSDYPYAWSYTILNRVFYIKNPAGWPGTTWNNRFQDAMAHWNNVTGVGLNFSLAGNAQSGDDACGPRDLVTYGAVDGQGTFVAVTVWCSSMNSTVKIVIDTADNPYDSGAATPNDPTMWDLEGVMTHELGHATRGWLKCVAPDQDQTRDPCAGMHFDPQHNGAICDTSDPQNYSTMCYQFISKAGSWRSRTLETHDVDTFQNAY